MIENQNIEFKSSWHDDILKTICGFANGSGGVVFVGKNDNGAIIGVENAKKLMEDIPNKIRNFLGLSSEVLILKNTSDEFIKINVESSNVAISYKGRYYLRSGSTKQELTGSSLNEFLLSKAGRTWDDVIEPRASFDDINKKTVNLFLKAAKNVERINFDEQLEIPELFEKLRLSEKGQLKRAAIILFGNDPGKFYPNTFVKMGRFADDGIDIKFQETEDGNLFFLLQEILTLLNHKFLIHKINYEGVHRIEKGEYPIAAIREMILNALVHRNYMGSPTQIRVYENRINIWNEGLLPNGITVDILKKTHPSRPRNPLIADVCFKGGVIESWGRGTLKIFEACSLAKLPEPEIVEVGGGILFTVFKKDSTTKSVGLNIDNLNDRQQRAIEFIRLHGEISRIDYEEINKVGKSLASKELKELISKDFISVKSSENRRIKYTLNIK